MYPLLITETASLTEGIRGQLLDLWNEEYPAQLHLQDGKALQDYLWPLNRLKHLLLQDKQGCIKGWAWSFDRDGERWFAIIVSTEQQGKGLGRQLIERLKNAEQTLNGWVTDHNKDIKQNGTPYSSPLDFYIKCGFEVLADQRLETEKMSAVKIRWTNIQEAALGYLTEYPNATT